MTTAAAPAGADLRSSTETSRKKLRHLVEDAVESLPGYLAVALVFVAWELSAAYDLIDKLFLPPPLEVLTALKGVVTSGTFMNDLGVSAYEFGWGLGLSILIGGVLGIASGWYR